MVRISGIDCLNAVFFFVNNTGLFGKCFLLYIFNQFPVERSNFYPENVHFLKTECLSYLSYSTAFFCMLCKVLRSAILGRDDEVFLPLVHYLVHCFFQYTVKCTCMRVYTRVLILLLQTVLLCIENSNAISTYISIIYRQHCR